MYAGTGVRTTSQTNHAARVARRVLGDLQSLVRLYQCATESKVAAYAHDIELGIEHSCISNFRFYLCSSSDGKVLEAYEYIVKENGEIEEASSSSGRHEFSQKLVNSSLEVQISFRDRDKWEQLKKDGLMEISWSPCEPKSLQGLLSQSDGAYKSGQLGVTRTSYRSV